MEQGSSYLLSNNLRNATVGFKAETFSFFYFIIFSIIIILFKMYLALTFKYTLFKLSRWPPSFPLQFTISLPFHPPPAHCCKGSFRKCFLLKSKPTLHRRWLGKKSKMLWKKVYFSKNLCRKLQVNSAFTIMLY